MVESKPLKVIVVSSINVVVSKLICICNDHLRITGMLFKPNDILVKRKTHLLGLSGVKNQRDCKKPRRDWLTSTCRRACLITATSTIFPHRKNKTNFIQLWQKALSSTQ